MQRKRTVSAASNIGQYVSIQALTGQRRKNAACYEANGYQIRYSSKSLKI